MKPTLSTLTEYLSVNDTLSFTIIDNEVDDVEVDDDEVCELLNDEITILSSPHTINNFTPLYSLTPHKVECEIHQRDGITTLIQKLIELDEDCCDELVESETTTLTLK